MCDDHAHGHDHRAAGPAAPLPLDRRSLLAGAGGALLLAGVPGTRAMALDTATGASRRSRLTKGTTLVHADLHNHTLLSDGDGNPDLAFAAMREAGLDVAALTDHATLSDNVLGDPLKQALLPTGYSSVAGITVADWQRTSALADAADTPGVFTAIRGFEWSEPTLGHVNVWFTRDYTDVVDLGDMGPLYDWLSRPTGPLLDGGQDGIAGFNHPGREAGRFEDFRYDSRARDQVVSLEMFNRRDDYLFEGYADGVTSPLVACLNAGWRPGLSGVTDEHGTDWGRPEGKGRSGLWVTENTRRGVMDAMKARRFFATRVSGLRLDATAAGARMGGTLPIAKGDVTFRLDLDRGSEWQGKPLTVQVLRPGTVVPRVAEVLEFSCGDAVRFTVPLDVSDGDWVVLRVSDPSQPNGTPGPAGHPCNEFGVAYSSPWWLQPA